MSLLDPIALGPRTASNRIVFGPHETNLAQGRAFSERHVAYYRRRAVGGAGVIVVEEASVHATDWPYERCPLATESAAGWASIATACQAEGSLVVAALGHSGGQGSTAYSQRPLWAPSRVPEVNTREVPKSMEPRDIDDLIAGFIGAASTAVAAGCDGVEINVGQFSLLRQFLSGLTNQRGDEWADRSALTRQVLSGVRSAIGPDHVLGLRLSCDELAPWAGIVPDVGAGLAAELAADADYVTVVRGAIFSAAATRPDGHVDPGFNLDLAGQVRAAVRAAHGDRVPVIAQGSIVDVGQAEWALGDSRCDAVEMTRAQIADADLVAKLAAGTPEQVRPCILCNQTCMVRDARNPIITCVVDPRTGHELTDHEPTAVGASGPVTIVGGGVAGLEAARIAATAGIAVRLVEAAATTGGMLRTASAGSGRARLAVFADWLDAECRRLGVEVETDCRVDAAELAGTGSPVVIATGSVPVPLAVPATKAALVLTAADHLDIGSAGLPSGPVLVWDPIGGPIAVSIAEQLGWEGRPVTLVTPDNIVGNELSRSGDLAPCNARLQQAGVVLERRSLLRAVKKGSVVLEDRFSGEQRNVKAAVVIDCGHRLPDDALFHETVAAAPAAVVLRAGDAVAPRTVLEAVREGRLAIAALDGSVRVSDGVPMPRSTAH